MINELTEGKCNAINGLYLLKWYLLSDLRRNIC